MNLRSIEVFLLVFAVFMGCAVQESVVTRPPLFPEGVLNARWGTSVERVKKAIVADGHQAFQDDTNKPSHALYAAGTYLNAPAILSYFFTATSGSLFRIDVTVDDPRLYELAKGQLVQRFEKPTFSHTDTDSWIWDDSSLVILQRDSHHVQVSYWSGPFLRINYRESAVLPPK